MALVAALTLPLAVGGCGRCCRPKPKTEGGPAPMTTGRLYEFSLPDIDGHPKALADYKGRVLLLVNVASQCGFTPQYTPLEALYEKYRERGLAVMGFPANNFGAQEPGTDAEIKAFCSTKYQVSFPLFAKISVKGEDIHPLYRYLTTEAGVDGDVKWNFAKFLVDRTGQVAARFEPKTAPSAPEVKQAVEKAIGA